VPRCGLTRTPIDQVMSFPGPVDRPRGPLRKGAPSRRRHRRVRRVPRTDRTVSSWIDGREHLAVAAPHRRLPDSCRERPYLAVQIAPGDIAARLLDHLMDRDDAPRPRMPRVQNLPSSVLWVSGALLYNRRRRHSSIGYLSPNEYERRHHERGRSDAREHAVVLAAVKDEPFGRPQGRAVLDRRCAGRPHQRAGRDGRMAPPGRTKEWTKPDDVRSDTVIPSAHPSTKPGQVQPWLGRAAREAKLESKHQ
jgi:hypothetical protein